MKKDIDYEKAYNELKDWAINLSPYCDTCLNEGDEEACDMCNRKAFNWECDPESLPEL